MFRGVVNLVGLIIDIDTFFEYRADDWAEITNIKKCLFITSNWGLKLTIETDFPTSYVYCHELVPFRKSSVAYISTFVKIIELLPSQTAFITADIDVIREISQFYIGTILVSDETLRYEKMAASPDFISSSLAKLSNVLKDGSFGMLAECLFSPIATRPCKISVLQGEIVSSHEKFRIFSAGRYFGQKNYVHESHPLSINILYSKNASHTPNKAHEEQIKSIYSTIVSAVVNSEPDTSFGITRVPPRPGCYDRFGSIVNSIASDNRIVNLSDSLLCIKNYDSQKNKSSFDERMENIQGAFTSPNPIPDLKVFLIDDVISTGATIIECASQLRLAGASEIIIIVLGINQLRSYFKSEFPIVHCENCNSAMKLRINTSNFSPFYGCSKYPQCMNILAQLHHQYGYS